jgi:hypothetical protein
VLTTTIRKPHIKIWSAEIHRDVEALRRPEGGGLEAQEKKKTKTSKVLTLLRPPAFYLMAPPKLQKWCLCQTEKYFFPQANKNNFSHKRLHNCPV